MGFGACREMEYEWWDIREVELCLRGGGLGGEFGALIEADLGGGF